jgi:dTDP-4-amino-4,6-dideoxygalactose transaminase
MVRDGLTEPSHGPWYYEVHEPGYNFRITDFQCALGLSQLGKLDRMIERRREIVSMYNRAFASVKELQLPFEAPDVRSSYHIYAIQLKLEALSVTRKEFFQALRAENIGVQVHYVPMHLHPYYRRTFGYAPGSMPVAEAYYERAITLPLFPLMTDGDVKDVVAAIHKLLAYYSSGRAEDASIKQYSTPLSR